MGALAIVRYHHSCHLTYSVSLRLASPRVSDLRSFISPLMGHIYSHMYIDVYRWLYGYMYGHMYGHRYMATCMAKCIYIAICIYPYMAYVYMLMYVWPYI